MPAEVIFHEEDLPPGSHTYVVFCCLYKDKLLVVRHRERTTWEIPGGHLEPGESPEDAAIREIAEETGATEFELTKVCDYSVVNEAGHASGRLYVAVIHEKNDKLEHEIAENRLVDQLPENLTYPDIQPLLLKRALPSYS